MPVDRGRGQGLVGKINEKYLFSRAHSIEDLNCLNLKKSFTMEPKEDLTKRFQIILES